MSGINIKITAFLVLVTAIFSGVIIDWQFEKDWTTLSRDGDVIAKSKWVVEAERTYINKNSPYRISHMCPRIIAEGGYETPTRCYYALDTYELLSRSLINTKIEDYGLVGLDNMVLKSVPFYAYSTRGSYAGFIKELIVFKDTEKIEEFPDSYMVTWEPKDTRNYKLVWRLEKLDTSEYLDGWNQKENNECSHIFGNVKIDLKDECSKLEKVTITKGKATFTFKPQRDNQLMDISFVDPELVEEEIIKIEEPKGLSMTMPKSWRITDINDTELLYDVEDISYDGSKFTFNMKAHESIINIPLDAKSIAPMVLEQNLTGKYLKESILNLPMLKDKLNINVKDSNRGKDLDTINFFDDYNRTTGIESYTFDVPADYVDGNNSYNRDRVVLKLGDASIYVTATLDTDLKIVQTGLSNDTDYVASIDVSEGKLFMSQTNSSYDLTDELVGWWSFDNVDNGTTAWDYAGNNNHGDMTNMNENLDNGSSGWTSSGNLSYGMDFDGVDDYVTCGNDASLNITSATMSMSAWINPNAISSQYATILNKEETYRFLLDNATDTIIFVVATDNNAWYTKTATSTGISFKGQGWKYLVGIYNGSSLLLYIDGVLNKETTGLSGNVLYSNNNLYFASKDGSTNYFNGTIDDVRIYNRALSSTEISALYNKTVDDYETDYTELSASAVTYDVISNTNTSVVVDINEIDEHYLFTPTYIRANHSSATNYTEFNTTDNSFYGSETITVIENYLGEGNLTRIRINNTYAMTEYDMYNINLSSHVTFTPSDITGIWYDSYTGNSDDSTLKQSTDYSQWVDTCESGNTTGMVLCFNFNEIYGTSAHDRANNSVNNNDGTLTNMNTGIDNGSSGWTRDGYFGNAIEFDGSNDFVDCGNDSSLIQNETITLIAWVNPTDLISTGDIIAHYKTTGNERVFEFQILNDKLYFLISEDGGFSNINTVTSNTAISTEWNHVVAIWNGTTMYQYINGVLDANTQSATLMHYSTVNFRIGGYESGRYFNGTIDEVKIYNRALSAAEILTAYNLEKQYIDYMVNQEGSTAASENLDVYVTNGTIGNLGVDGTVTIVPQSNMTSSMWMIDFGLTGGYTTDYDYSCGDITTDVPTEVSTNKNGSYALSVSGEMSPLGMSEKLKFGLMKYPIRYTNDSYRAYFQVADNLTKDTVTQLNFNVSDVLDRMNITTADVDTYRLYRISYFGGIHNDTGVCLEQPIWVGA